MLSSFASSPTTSNRQFLPSSKSEDVDWEKLIADWDIEAFQGEKRRILHVAVGGGGNGIPDYARRSLWPLMCGAADLAFKSDVFTSLVACRFKNDRLLRGIESSIKRDLPRTFPSHAMFKDNDGDGQLALLDILMAYAAFDRSVGYCQGMNFIAGYCLLNLAPEGGTSIVTSFWVFVCIMKKCKTFFCKRIPGFVEALAIMNEMLEMLGPNLAAHFDEEGITCSMFASTWFHTLFAHEQIPSALTLRVWDAFLAPEPTGGLMVLFRVGLAALLHNEDLLVSLPCEHILDAIAAHSFWSFDALEAAFALDLPEDVVLRICSIPDLDVGD